MKTLHNATKHHYVTRIGMLLIAVTLIAATVSCAPVRYDLTIASSEGGSVTTPGEGMSTYEAGTVVSLVASPASGHRFVNWTGDVDTIADVNAASTTITLEGDYKITANFVAQYVLTIDTTEGGEVTAPGEGTFTYDAGTVVNLVTEADEGYKFMEWTGDVDYVTDANAASTTVTMNSGYTITASFAKEIRNWHDLDAIGDNLSGHYVLVNDLDATSAGYAELAGPAANGGKGWEPVGGLSPDQFRIDISDPVDPFRGSLDGQGHEIRDVFVDRPDEDGVGLFGFVGAGGVVRDVGAVNGIVTGRAYVGGLVGGNKGGVVIDSHCSGTVTGERNVGGLIGYHGGRGTVSNSSFAGSVTGSGHVGGLVGWHHWGTIGNSYFTGTVAGEGYVGGLVGATLHGTVTNSYYNYDEVLINGKSLVTIGALLGEDFEQWLANDKFLDVNERLLKEDGYYVIASISDFKQLLAFGQDGSLRFKLTNDLDFGGEANFFIPHLGAELNGNGHTISNLSLNFDIVSEIGLFGYLAPSGKVTQLGLENANISTKGADVGSLVGLSDGIVSDCYSTGSVIGRWGVGGLVGSIHNGTLRNSYFGGSVTGEGNVGGLVGFHFHGLISNSYYNHDEVLINGENIITVGALLGEDFEQWLANDRFLDVDEKLSSEDGYYLISNISDFKQLLAFGQDGSLKFRLTNDLDLAPEPNFYIPHLAAEFDGNGHTISNFSLDSRISSQVGLFGYLARGGRITRVGLENANVTGNGGVGGLAGHSYGTISNSYASGRVSGGGMVGGLVGHTRGTVSNCYSSGSVVGGSHVGGLVGDNFFGTISNSYSTSSVTGYRKVGGLVGANYQTVSNSYSTGSVTGDVDTGGLVGFNIGTVSASFWNTQTSGQAASAGGTGKTTAEMKDIATFRTAGWSIVAVATGETDRSRTWNIVDGEAYPFFSWESVL
ncbi:MAG: GLUG motif-containing protein [Dehalococcoidia bacterium]